MFFNVPRAVTVVILYMDRKKKKKQQPKKKKKNPKKPKTQPHAVSAAVQDDITAARKAVMR